MDVDLNQKRQREFPSEIDDDEITIDTSKRNKVNTTVKDDFKITNLNDDCLEEIFKFLKLTDLIAVISTNTRFSNSVCSVFWRKYGRGKINISNSLTPESHQSTHDSGSDAGSDSDDFELDDMLCSPQAVKMMRHFGHLITKMQVKYYPKYRRLDYYIDHAILKYCQKTLIEISFINADYFTLFEIKKPFPNVLKVCFTAGIALKLISNFNKWLPHAEHLDLIGTTLLRYEDKDVLAQHFPKLRHLGVNHTSVRNYWFTDFMMYQNKEFLDTIEFNPQLKSLTFEIDTKNNINLETINTKLPELTDLGLNLFNYNYSPDQVNFKCLKRLRIEFYRSFVLPKIPILANEVEHIELIGTETCRMESPIDRVCLKFLQQYQNVKIVFIRGQWKSNEILFDSFENLPNLSELIIDTPGIVIQTEPIVNMVNNCKSLTKLHISVDVKHKKEFVGRYKQGFNQIVASVGSGWISKMVTYDPENFSISLKLSKN